MTRNQFIASGAKKLVTNGTSLLPDPLKAIGIAIDAMEVLADKLEKRGCAPWQDAPMSAPLQFDFPQTPARREITVADVVVGAVFTLGDGTTHTVKELVSGMGGPFIKTANNSSHYKANGKIWEPSVGTFVRQMNEANATVTLPE